MFSLTQSKDWLIKLNLYFFALKPPHMKLFFLLAMLISLGAVAQPTLKPGQSGHESSTLSVTDNQTQNRHYKQLPITLQKGMGAVFYMESNEFRPYLVFLSPGDGNLIGTTRVSKENGGDRVTVSFTSTADTSFYILFSTNDPGATGKFTYGYTVLEPDQMMFNTNFTFCQRLNYLINHWQSNWDLLPTTNQFHADTEDPELSYNYRSTANSLIIGDAVEIVANYREVVFSTKDFTSLNNFYKKICEDITACLDASQWDSQTAIEEVKLSAYSDETRKKIVTHYFLKGAKGEHLKSFDVLFNPDNSIGLLTPMEVVLVFN